MAEPVRLGRYELGPVLGAGGAGRVHRAELVGPGRFRMPVALKVLHRGGEELRREARIGGLLRHKNLVDVYEIGESDGQWFCALELCAGTLASHLPLPPRAVVEVGLQVCAALQYAHGALGLVHMDLKPDNLLLSAEGVVKVADLGIARAAGFDLSGIRGTRGYMAPELVRGGAVDLRADIYALGVTLVELATGARTGLSATLELTEGAEEDSQTVDVDSFGPESVPPVALGAAGLGIPEWLAPAVGRCLHDAPEDRWPDMAALAEALGALAVAGDGLREALGIAEPTPAASLGAKDNLGQEPDAFVGREADLASLLDALDTPGLLSVEGPPGLGKSRLASAAARRWRDQSGGQAWFCDLTEARSLEGFVAAVARVLSVPLSHGDLAAQLGHALASRGPMVLVLDNFEQIAELAPVVEAWHRRATQARIVVTSRVTTGLGQQLRPGRLSDEAAVALLVARARQRGAEVALDPDVLELARRLDHMPLALELAAGRLGVLSVRDVLDRLGLSLLRAGGDERNSSLHAALDWSWELLSETDRIALASLSVFAGGFALEAAEQVVALGDASVLDAIASLTERSMVVSVAGGRFRLLASVREYAGEKLGDREQVELRHGQWCAALLTAAGPSGSVRQLAATQREIENLVAACRRAICRGDGEVAVGALQGCWSVYGLTGPSEAGAELAVAVAAMDLPPGLGTRAHVTAGTASRAAANMERAGEHLRTALQLAIEAGDRAAEGSARFHLGVQHRQLGQLDQARSLYVEALELLSAADPSGAGEAHNSLGLLCVDLGEMEIARGHYSAGLAIARAQADRSLEASVMGNWGLLHSHEGRVQEAAHHYQTALAISRELGDRRGEGEVLGNLGVLSREHGRTVEARAYYEAALAVNREVGNRRFEAIVLGNLGNLCRMEGDVDAACAYYEDSMALHTEIGNRRSFGIVLANIGNLRLDQGHLDLARPQLQGALEVAIEVGFRRLEGWVLTLLCRIEAADGQLDRAEGLLSRAEEILHTLREPALIAQMLVCRAELRARSGDPVGASQLLAEARATAPPAHADTESSIARVSALLLESSHAR